MAQGIFDEIDETRQENIERIGVLETERWQLMNSFGNGSFADGAARDRITEIDRQIAGLRPAA